MKVQRLSLDRISILPPSITEIILCLLPIRDAARTSILSRNWRHSWVTIHKLEFIQKDFEVTTDEGQLSNVEKTYNRSSVERKMMKTRRRIFYAIYQILLVHRGPIHEFILSMNIDYRCVEIDQILLHLSRNYTVKKIKLDVTDFFSHMYKVPSSIFSLHQLTDLYLKGCYLNYLEDTFKGFGSLTSLHLVDVTTFTGTILHIICTSPLLKSVTLTACDVVYTHYECDYLTIADLFKFLSVIEHIVISHSVIEACVLRLPVTRELPYTFVCLKSFFFKEVGFEDKYGLPFLVLLMRCSPNLEKIHLLIWEHEYDEDNEIQYSDYSEIHMEHLNELKIEDFINSKRVMEFVKHILATSPILKKVSIVLDNDVVDNDGELKILRILLRLPRASPMLDIIVERPPR